MRFLLLFLPFISINFTINSQGCGTEVSPQALQHIDNTLEQRASYISTNSTQRASIQVPVVFWDVVTSSGGGNKVPYSKYNQLINLLNSSFSGTGLNFYICKGPYQIKSNTYYDFNRNEESSLTSSSSRYISRSLNIYFFNSVQTGSYGDVNGYSHLPSNAPSRNAVYVDKATLSNSISTTIHEVGHFFSLMHTHGPSNTVRTTERVNGSNCSSSGDRICDTPADPNLNGKVTSSCTYVGTERDANNQPYNPSVRNVMSYSARNCRNQFTPTQKSWVAYSAQNDYSFSCSGTTTGTTTTTSTSNASICSYASTINCGVTYSGSTTSGTSLINYYSCGGQNESGKEKVYKIITTSRGSISATLSNYTADVDIHILSGCYASTCVARGDVSASASNLPAGTYYIVVDGYNGAQGSYNIRVNCSSSSSSSSGSTTTNTNNQSLCSYASTISCGVTYSGNTSGGSDIVDYYGCGNQNESGRERVYKITTTSRGNLSATLSNYSADVDVHILSGCYANTCIARGNISATASNVPAGTYYVVVDGYGGAQGSYNIRVDCSQGSTSGGGTTTSSSSSSASVCSKATALSCGVTYAGNNFNGYDDIDYYNCGTQNESGKERIYKITTNSTGIITATLSNMSADLDVHILNGCYASNCVARGDVSASINAAPGTYYVVVDGYNGASGSYYIRINCSQSSAEMISESTVCDSTTPISCGETIVNQSNANGTDLIDNYSCAELSYYGLEKTYEISLTDTTNLNVVLSNTSTDFGVHILGGCLSNDCIASGVNSLEALALIPGNYLIVIDGQPGRESGFDISVQCNQQPKYEISTFAYPLSAGIVMGSGLYNEGQSVNVLAQENFCWEFDKWVQNGIYMDSSSMGQSYQFEVYQNSWLTAEFTQKRERLNVTSNIPLLSYQYGEGEYFCGDSVQISTYLYNDNSGYVFENWSNAGQVFSTSPITYVQMNNLMDIKANYTFKPTSNINEQVISTYHVFPNPTTGIFNITSDNIEIKNIQIYSAVGQLILEKNVNAKKATFDLENLSTGIYQIFIIDNENRIVNHKIVKN